MRELSMVRENGAVVVVEDVSLCEDVDRKEI